MKYESIEPFELAESYEPEFHAYQSISFGELRAGGWVDWDDELWYWDWHDEDQRSRVQALIDSTYYDAEIANPTLNVWRIKFIGRLDYLMSKYGTLYDLEWDLNADGGRYGKDRHVYSNYPLKILASDGNADFADTGEDQEYEWVDKASPYKIFDYIDKIESVDTMIVNGLDGMFTHFFTPQVNV